MVDEPSSNPSSRFENDEDVEMIQDEQLCWSSNQRCYFVPGIWETFWSFYEVYGISYWGSSKELSNDISYAHFRSVTKEIWALQNQCTEKPRPAPIWTYFVTFMTIYVISYFVSPKTTLGMCFGILGFILGLFQCLFYFI